MFEQFMEKLKQEGKAGSTLRQYQPVGIGLPVGCPS